MSPETGLFVLQHPKERFHPIGTVRIARLGIPDLRVVLDDPGRSEAGSRPPGLPEDLALVYPTDDVPTLSELSPEQRPKNLLFLDGTWHHAKVMFRDNPWVQALPRVRLDPAAPSRYRIRREPAAHCISTLEAMVHALDVLEPELEGLNGLLQAFDTMIDRQAAHQTEGSSGRHRGPRASSGCSVPRALGVDPERLVVVYAEGSERLPEGCSRRERPLLQWTAWRGAETQTFEALLSTAGVPRPYHREMLGIGAQAFDEAMDLDAFREAWAAWIRPNDLLLAWNQSTFDLLDHATGAAPTSRVVLKGAWCNYRKRSAGGLETVIEAEALQPKTLPFLGRAGLRAGRAAAVADFLRAKLLSAAADA